MNLPSKVPVGRLYIEQHNNDGTFDVIIVFGEGKEKIFHELTLEIMEIPYAKN